MSAAVTQSTVRANGLRFSYLEAGEGPLALCLHGFPDCAWTWRELLPALAEAGYHAVAPWTRGYAPTEVPADGRYQAGALVADALALHDALGGDDAAIVVGHDWGAYAAYGAAAHAPERWRRVVTLAVPPLALAAQALLRYDQLKRSWYFFFFGQPVAEEVVSADDFAFVERLWADWSPGFDGGEALVRAKDALRGEGHVSAALGYYRALVDPSGNDPSLAALDAAVFAATPRPTLYLHGDRDGAFAVEDAAGAERYLAPGSRFSVVEGAGHFPHLEQARRVREEILAFVRPD